jgi:phosphoribosylformimino-5-aminoimidazole carboxamide ribotide isomerase
VLTRNTSDDRDGFAVIPAVDVLGDEAVRLEQGDFARVVARRHDPIALIGSLRDAGVTLVHLVDLESARTGKVRPELVRRAVAAAEPAGVQAAGGIRSIEDAGALLEAGAARVVVGTAAFADDSVLEGYVEAIGDRLVVAIDVRRDAIAVDGWERSLPLTPEEAAGRCREAGVRRLACTAIERDGTLAGPALELLELVCARSGLPVLAAGGVRSIDDLSALAAIGCEGAIVGRALLEGLLPPSIFATAG